MYFSHSIEVLCLIRSTIFKLILEYLIYEDFRRKVLKLNIFAGKQYSEVVFPRRVTRRGDFISHFLPNTYKRVQPQRYKRSLGENIHYLVPFRGTNYHLELTPNHQLISPGMVIENHRKRISERSINHANETQCHYTGFIRGDKNSKVAISTCNGLVSS